MAHTTQVKNADASSSPKVELDRGASETGVSPAYTSKVVVFSGNTPHDEDQHNITLPNWGMPTGIPAGWLLRYFRQQQ
ncbi:hypothetical protein WJX79_000379 [Trebouxia sp. C0005]